MIPIIVVLLALTFIGVRYVLHKRFPDKFDKNWPQKDLTSGPFSDDYDGIDISHHQGKIRWYKLTNTDKIKFIYVKATEGTSVVDPWYNNYVDSVKASAIPVGAYLFMSKRSPALQFANFSAHYSKSNQDILPVIDVEDDGTSGWDSERIRKNLKILASLMEGCYGEKPIIYCSEKYYNDNLSPDFDDYILWIAKYSSVRPVLKGDACYTIWQFSRHGRVKGIYNRTDLNRFAPGKSVEDIMFKDK
nr:glycosyl hydrolase [Prevotella sp.]